MANEARVLILCADGTHYQRVIKRIDKSLILLHGKWTVCAECHPAIDGGVDKVEAWQSLDIVLIEENDEVSKAHLEASARHLAHRLASDPRRPWVVIGKRLEFLQEVFHTRGIRTDRDVANALKRRKVEQMRSSAHA